MDDWELICAYRNGSEKAFSELVERYGDLVYSAAHRLLHGNNAQAEDVAQKTFALFARKLPNMNERTALVGWLYKTACNLSREVLRNEARRRVREMEAMSMHSTQQLPESNWGEIAPLLEEAMLALPENERLPVLLRFFERKAFRDVANTLGVSEDAAKMRVSRALQKLRRFFAGRGVSVSAATLGTFLWDHSVMAVPVGVLASLGSAQIASIHFPLSIATKWILMSNLQKSAIVAVSLLLLSTTGYQFQKHYARKALQPSPTAAGNHTAALNSSNANSATTANSLAAVHSRQERAIASLRRALTEPWPDRRLPEARLIQALEDLGPHRASAVPVLLEYLGGLRSQRSLSAMVGAAYCLELMGTEAAAAIPELLVLGRSGDLALLNDSLPKLFVALSPDGAVLPDLIEMLKDAPDAGQIQKTVAELLHRNPATFATHRPALEALLGNENQNAQFLAAKTLATLPGQANPMVEEILVENLKLERMRDPSGYADVVLPDGNTVVRAHERFSDDTIRLQALQSLGAMGPAASNSLPMLGIFSQSAPTNSAVDLRGEALAAIARIDPSSRLRFPEVDAAYRAQERTAELLEKTQSGTASLSDILEALRNRWTVGSAAEALRGHPEARAALPDLEEAIDRYKSNSAVDRIKELEPLILLERVKNKNLNGINDVARALGELGPSMMAAVPYLAEILNETRPGGEDVARPYPLDEAIRKIDPNYPKLLYKIDDLHAASAALVQKIYSENKVRSPVYEAYVRDFQDINAVSRGHLLRFVEATKADPDLHALFVSKLLEKNPELAGELRHEPGR